MATHIWGNGMEFENPLVVTLDSKVVYETVIGGEEDMKLYDQVQNGALDRVNARLKNIRFSTTAGPHRSASRSSAAPSPSPTTSCRCSRPAAARIGSTASSSFQLRGPFNAKGLSATPSRERIFTCQPAAGATPTRRRCAKTDHRVAGQARLPPSGLG